MSKNKNSLLTFGKSNRVIPVLNMDQANNSDLKLNIEGPNTERAPVKYVKSDTLNDFHEVSLDDFNEFKNQNAQLPE